MILISNKGTHLSSQAVYSNIDNFKNINDERGHAAGDRLLERAATRLKRSVHGCDTVARIAATNS